MLATAAPIGSNTTAPSTLTLTSNNNNNSTSIPILVTPVPSAAAANTVHEEPVRPQFQIEAALRVLNPWPKNWAIVRNEDRESISLAFEQMQKLNEDRDDRPTEWRVEAHHESIESQQQQKPPMWYSCIAFGYGKSIPLERINSLMAGNALLRSREVMFNSQGDSAISKGSIILQVWSAYQYERDQRQRHQGPRAPDNTTAPEASGMMNEQQQLQNGSPLNKRKRYSNLFSFLPSFLGGGGN